MSELQTAKKAGKETSAYTKAAAFVPVVTEVLGLYADNMARESQNEFLKSEMKNAEKTFLFNTRIRKQQLQDLRESTADVLTERGIKALEEEATLRAGAAETGTAGGTTTAFVESAYVREMQDKTQILRDSKKAKRSITSAMESDIFGYGNTLRSISNQSMTASQAGMSALNASVAGFSTGLNLLDDSTKEYMFSSSKTEPE